MINIRVDLTNINKKLGRLQDTLGAGKTDKGKNFMSAISESALRVFSENSIDRMQSNEPPDVQHLRRRGKRKSMRAYALAKVKPIFILEKKINTNGAIIGIGIDIYKAQAHLPVEAKYLPTGEFAAYMANRIPYDFAGTNAENVFLVRHFGTGTRGILPGYIGRRLYPNNLAIFTTGGRLFTTRFLVEQIEAELARQQMQENQEGDDESFDDKDLDSGDGYDFNPADALFGGGIGKTKTYEDEEGSSGKIKIIDHILSQISEDTRDDFLHGSFSSTKTIEGRQIIMWHKGIPPYDWFKDTSYGATQGKAFKLDVDTIKDKIDLFYDKAISEIMK